MELPESFVAEGLAIAEGAVLFGKRLPDCTRDELLAAAAQGWAAERRAREQGAARTRSLLDLMRRAP